MSLQSVDLYREFANSLHLKSWQVLAEAVRDYNPDIVVLVARKTPGIVRLLELDFGPACVISDFAISYTHSIFSNSRVAIVDDLVNVGSTMENARNRVLGAGACEARLFALAMCEEKATIVKDVFYSENSPWPLEYAKSFAVQIPHALLFANKPYDFEFPIIPCTISMPYLTENDLFVKLKEIFGIGSIFDITHPYMRKKGLFRWSVILPQQDSSNFKLRFYVDINSRICNLVPFAISKLNHQYEGGFQGLPVELSPFVDAFYLSLNSLPKNVEVISGESIFRASLFLRSWVWGLNFLDSSLAEVLAVTDVARISLDDVQILFGSDIRRCFEESCISIVNDHRKVDNCSIGSCSSPQSFLSYCPDLINNPIIQTALSEGLGAFDLFISLFKALSDIVGAEDPRKYALSGPYTKEQISENPYLRLRIGLTFSDLLGLCDQIAQITGEYYLSSPCCISAMLDWAIDQGGVVPVVACYDGHLYRVYRKGERTPHDEGCRQKYFAISSYNEPISRTRMAKVFAIMAFSARIPDTVSPSALPRGNVGTFSADSVLNDDNCDITRYFRDTGLIEKA